MNRFGYRPQPNWGQTSSATDDVSWSFNRIQALAGPGNSTLLHRPETGAKMLVQPDVAQALSLCTNFRSLDSHTDTILTAMPHLAAHRENTLQTLQSIRDSGILESSDEAWQRLVSNEQAGSIAKSCRIFIPTCDRPEALQRLLDSVTKITLPEAIEGIWIIDDSRNLQSEQDNRGIVTTIQSKFEIPVIHFDSGSRNRLIAHLKANSDAAEEIDWLLDRGVWGNIATYGIARTLALLLSIGKHAIMLDDDILLDSVLPPLATGGLQFDSGEGREAVFYASKEEMHQHALPSEVGVLSGMLDYLGGSVGSILQRHMKTPSALRGSDGAHLARFGRDGFIAITQCGYWGDAGTISGNWIFHLSHKSIERLLAESGLEERLKAQATWTGYKNPSITPYGVMSAVTGLDNSRLLPPYLPAGRGEDVLFGIMTQRIHPESGVFNLAAAVPHLPVDERQDRANLAPIDVTPHLSLLGDWLGREADDRWGVDPDMHLSSVAEDISRLAGMSTPALEALASQLLVSKTAELLKSCMMHLEHASQHQGLPASEAWTHFLEASQAQLVKKVQERENRPLGNSGQTWAQQDFSFLRKNGRALASSLRKWSEIREVAGAANW